MLFDRKGAQDFKNCRWISCQVGRLSLFQILDSAFSYYRILRVDEPTKKCFSIEKEGDMSGDGRNFCLANFLDQFIFHIGSSRSRRYSLAEDTWEELLHIAFEQVSACSLIDKVYVFSKSDREFNCINILNNPGASISSKEPPYWDEIRVPIDALKLRSEVAFVPLNWKEIAIFGGVDTSKEYRGGIVTFNRLTH